MGQKDEWFIGVLRQLKVIWEKRQSLESYPDNRERR